MWWLQGWQGLHQEVIADIWSQFAVCTCNVKILRSYRNFAKQLLWLQGWQGLQQELLVDMLRLWQRNLGRDDRLVADTSRFVMLQVYFSQISYETVQS